MRDRDRDRGRGRGRDRESDRDRERQRDRERNPYPRWLKTYLGREPKSCPLHVFMACPESGGGGYDGCHPA
eukprot:7985244-Prorocentrum_lima.AAC.1